MHMKRTTALTGLFLTAALLASPVFAANTICDDNLQKIKDDITEGATDMGEDTMMNLNQTQKEAMAAKAAGNDKKCIELTEKALADVEKSDSGDSDK
jgi:hypothetical protein